MMAFTALHPQEAMLQPTTFEILGKFLLYVQRQGLVLSGHHIPEVNQGLIVAEIELASKADLIVRIGLARRFQTMCATTMPALQTAPSASGEAGNLMLCLGDISSVVETYRSATLRLSLGAKPVEH